MEKNFSFSIYNNFAKNGIKHAVNECNKYNKKPIIVCIGSDLVLGDSLGPLVGTFLKNKKLNAYVYGTLNLPITAKEISYAKTYLKQMHPDSVIIAIDAAIGNESDIGIIKVYDSGLKPGLGVKKELGIIGDISIVGIVAAKSLKNFNLFNLTRLNLVYKMAEIISDSLEEYLVFDGKKDNEVFGT